MGLVPLAYPKNTLSLSLSQTQRGGVTQSPLSVRLSTTQSHSKKHEKDHWILFIAIAAKGLALCLTEETAASREDEAPQGVMASARREKGGFSQQGRLDDSFLLLPLGVDGRQR